MKQLNYFIFALISLIVVSCYIPEKRVDFELQPSGTRDQATNQQEIAPGLLAVFMHGYQTRVYVQFEFEGRKRLKQMDCIATLKKEDGTTYTQEFHVESMIMKIAFVDDQTHISWMTDDLISLELGGKLYKLYDQKLAKRALRKLYNASENQSL